jgi:hypothetical protein
MKIGIRKIKDGLFRTYYDLGGGETTIPFKTYEEAALLKEGLERAVEELESIRRTKALKERLYHQSKEQGFRLTSAS